MNWVQKQIYCSPEQLKVGLNKVNICYKTAPDAQTAPTCRGQRSFRLKGCRLLQQGCVIRQWTDVGPFRNSLTSRKRCRRWSQPSCELSSAVTDADASSQPQKSGGPACVSHVLFTATSEQKQYDKNAAFPSKRRVAASEIPLHLSILDVITEERQQCGPALHTKAPCSLLFCTWLSRKLPPSLTHHLRAAVLTKLLIESLLRRSRALSETFPFSTTEALLWLTFRNPKSLDAPKNRNTHTYWKISLTATARG